MLLVFGRAWRNDFITLDDGQYILLNPDVVQGLTARFLAWAFSTFHAANWHPLTWLSHMLDVEIFGLWPGGHHLTSVAIHAASSVLLFLFLRQATRRLWPAALAAALFALHPLHIESVAWASERKDVLSGLFWILTLLAYGRYVRRPGRARYLVVIACFGAGLLAKPMLVTLPFVLLLLDRWPFERWGGAGARRLLLEKVPLLALSAVSSAVTLAAQRSGGSVSGLAAVPIAERVANAALSYVWYLGKTVWPNGLAILYPHPALAAPGEASALLAAGGAALTLAAASVLAVRVRRGHPHLLVGWLWYLGTLVPVIGLVQIGAQARADRYSYIPLIGIFIAAAWELCLLVERRPSLRAVVACAVAALLASFAVTSAHAVSLWRDSVTLYRHALSVTERNWVVHYSLAQALERLGRFEEARAQHEAALAIRPQGVDVLQNYAAFLRNRGDLVGARKFYEAALGVAPGFLEARNNLGAVLAAQGDAEGAAREFAQCLREEPEFVPAWYNLGTLRAERGDLPGAASAFAEAVRFEPRHAEAHNALAAVLLRQGQPREAARQAERALGIRPDYFRAWFNLGLAALESGDLARARAALERAVELEPSNAQAHAALARVLESERRLRDRPGVAR